MLIAQYYDYCHIFTTCFGGYLMLSWAVVFLIIAIIAAVFGFSGIAAASAGIAKILFFIFIVLFVISLVFGLIRRPPRV